MNIFSKHNAIVVILLSVFAFQSLGAVVTQSATYDEVGYIGIGKYLLRHHRWDIPGSILHPPFSYYLNSLPLLFVKEDQRVWNYDAYDREYRTGSHRLELLGTQDLTRGQALLSSSINKNDRLLIACRLMTLGLAVLLGWYVYRFSRLLYGEKAGLLALLLYAFCPNMLAYSGLIVPDMPLAALALITMYYYYRLRAKPDGKGIAAAGICLGLAILSKFTALLLVPATLVTLLAWNEPGRRTVRSLVFSFAVAILVVLAGYFFDLRPFWDGLRFQWAHAQEGHEAFLLGNHNEEGWWYYYLVVFLIKTPIPLTLLSGFAAMTMWLKYPDKRRDLTLLLLVPVSFFLLFSVKHQSIGIRYLLPVYPFLFVVAGSLASRRQFRIPIIIAVVWFICGTLYVSPHYLPYMNEAVGGPGNGYKLLVDSNLDWGQDLKSLKKFMDKEGISTIGLSFFGADSPSRYGINFYEIPPVPQAVPSTTQRQLLAISATHLQGVYLEDREAFAKLRSQKPLTSIGYSILIYDLNSFYR